MRTMSHSLARMLLTLMAGVLLVSSALQARSMYDRFQDASITVRDRTKDRDVPIILRNINDEAIEYSPINYPEGVLELPLNNEELRLFFEYPREEWNSTLNAIRQGAYEQAVEYLRPMGYPLIKYLVLPEDRFNGHEVVLKLYSSLILGGMFEEALDMAHELPLQSLNPQFMTLTMDLAQGLVDTENTVGAIRVIRLIPLNEEQAEFFPVLLSFANSLRTRGEYEAALVLYERMRQVPDAAVVQTATLWTSYIYLLLENYPRSEALLQAAGEIDRVSRAFSLSQLIQGRLFLANDNAVDAVDILAQGIVSSDVSLPWMPDLLFSAGLCYESLTGHPAFGGGESEGDAEETSSEATSQEPPQNLLVASNIYYQLQLFYPENPWTEKALVRMASLPKPAEVEAALPDEALQNYQEQMGGSDPLTGGDGWD